VSEPRWLTIDEVLVIHERQLSQFGGAAGLRDRGMLESALSRPQNKWLYEQAGLEELAASYAYGLAKNHAFIDGNKRVSFIVMMAFLRLNGVQFAPEPAAATAIILDLAAGLVSEDGLTRWIRDNLPKA
jgi:death-on-curing protein